MQDAEALKGKSLAELREIGRSMGIKAQMRKQELLDRILELSARGDSSPAGAEAAQPEVPVPEGEENVPEKKRRGRRPKGYVRVESVENPSADEAVPEQEGAENAGRSSRFRGQGRRASRAGRPAADCSRFHRQS